MSLTKWMISVLLSHQAYRRSHVPDAFWQATRCFQWQLAALEPSSSPLMLHINQANSKYSQMQLRVIWACMHCACTFSIRILVCGAGQ
jgi:hypothetical protein